MPNLRAIASALGLLALLGTGPLGCLSTSAGAGPGQSHDAGSDDAGLGTPVVSVSSTSQGFGTVSLGSSSTPTSIVVTNTGTGPTGVLAASLGGASPASFVIDSDMCTGQILPAGDNCAISLHFAPAAPGTYTASLTVVARPGGSVVLALSGTATAPGALSIAPVTLDYGPVVTGQSSAAQTFSITNTGGQPTGTLASALSGSDAPEFALGTDGCTGTTLAAGQSCSVDVTFAPNAAGTMSASLTVSGTPGGSTSATLAGTALTGGALAVGGTTTDFGSATVGAVSKPLTFTVTNTGQGATGTVTPGITGTNAAEFAIASTTCGPALGAGANCAIVVTFDPATAGPKTATIGAGASPGGTAGIAVTATAIAQAALSTTTASPTSFGSIVLGQTSTDALFAIQNTGGVASGDLAMGVTGTNAADFKIDSAKTTCTAGALAAGASCSVAVTFKPSVATGESATLTVSATPGGSLPFPLSGTGLTPGALEMAPATYPFAATLLGQTNGPEPFKISNTGQSATGTLATSITGSGASQFKITSDACNGKTLAAAGDCAVSVEFAPTASGGASATLLVTTTGAGGSASASVSGTGQAPAKLAWGSASYPCGSTAKGTSTTTTLVLDNQGDIAATAPTFASSGTNGADFSVASSTCGSGIAARSSCNVTVTFTPKTTAGESATLTATAATGGSAATSVTGTGEVPAAFSISPAPFGFPSAVVKTTGTTQLFTITNVGGVSAGTATALALSVTGANAGDFAMSSNTCPATLGAKGTCSVKVTFSPTTTSGETATLGVTASPGTAATSVLTGTGLTPGALSIGPTPVNFDGAATGIVDGTQTADTIFTVTNTGGGTTTAISASINDGAASPFVIDTASPSTNCPGATLLGGGTCTIAVYFAPTTLGPLTAPLTVTASGNGSSTATLNGTGLSAAALGLTTSPKTTSFGAHVDGVASNPITFTLSNGGTQPTGPITMNFGGANGGDWSVVGSPACISSGLAGSATCAISLQFIPSIVGSESASISASASPGGTSSPAVAVTGIGYSTGVEVLVSPNPDNWPAMMPAEQVPAPVTVTNVGGTASSALAISVALTGTHIGSEYTMDSTCTGVALAANGGTCTFNVYFQSRATGSFTGTLTISEGSSDTITVPLASDVGADQLSITPTSWDVTTCTTQAIEFAITNDGTTETGYLEQSWYQNITTITNVGTFSILSDGCAGTFLGAGSTCYVEVEFTPTDGCAGTGNNVYLEYSGLGSYDQSLDITLYTTL